MNSSASSASAESFFGFFVAENSHPVLRNWFLVSSPWPSIAGSLLYLLFAIVIGPAFMANRKPFEIKGIMNLYNAVQVIFNVYFFHGYWTYGWGTYYNWVCQPVDMDLDPDSLAMRFNTVYYHAYLFRYVDMCDTFFFIMRKKYKNVNVLQLTHHAIMPIFGWHLMYWAPNGHESFGGIFNALVHSIMYTYYFLAAMGPQFQKYLWWKRYLTQLQLIQFVAVFVKSAMVIAGISNCGFPWQVSLVTLTLMVLMLVLFGHFYVQEYTSKKKRRSSLKSN